MYGDLPHDSVNHFIDDFINDDKEVNDSFSCLSEGSKNSSERETKEDYSKGVCSGSVNKSIYIQCMYKLCISNNRFIVNDSLIKVYL